VGEPTRGQGIKMEKVTEGRRESRKKKLNDVSTSAESNAKHIRFTQLLHVHSAKTIIKRQKQERTNTN